MICIIFLCVYHTSIKNSLKVLKMHIIFSKYKTEVDSFKSENPLLFVPGMEKDSTLFFFFFSFLGSVL